jgi:hypothetical protein
LERLGFCARPPRHAARATCALAAALLVACFSATAHAASSAAEDKVLPFTVQVPYGFLFLHLPAISAEIPPLHAWGFEAWSTVTNNFIYSDNVGDFLATRTSRAPMTSADFDAIAAANPGEDYYYYDGQITTLYARVATTVAPSLAVGARFSVIGISGGQGMDGFVEGFHSLFGLGQSHRDVVTRGETTSAIRIGANSDFNPENPRVGVGDPIVFAIWAPERGMGAWRIGLIAGIKVPIGSTSKRLSTGRGDFGTAFALTGDLGRWFVNVNGGVMVPGDIEFFPGLDPVTMFGVSGSVGVRFRTTSLWVQLQWEQSPLRHATDMPLTDDVYDVSIGLRFPLARSVRGFVALTENVVAFENSSDIGFHGGVSWVLDGK